MRDIALGGVPAKESTVSPKVSAESLGAIVEAISRGPGPSPLSSLYARLAEAERAVVEFDRAAVCLGGVDLASGPDWTALAWRSTGQVVTADDWNAHIRANRETLLGESFVLGRSRLS